jgi:2-keto-4-pentenoate hydratase
MTALRTFTVAAILGWSLSAQAGCLGDAEVAALADAMAAKTPAANPRGLNETDAACSRAKLLTHLANRHGAVAGYKAGLTNPAVQKRFNHDRPVWGVLYRSMLRESGASVEAAFGARPLYEADLLVRVKSAHINQAKTALEVLDAIDQVIPFIELPDLVVQAPPQLDGHAISAINVGARLGVTGTPIAVPPYRGERYALLDGLRDMTVVMSDTQDVELARGKGSDVLGHPLHAVVWLVEALAKEGKALKPGDLISVGSFSPLLPPRAGLGVTVNYLGLPGATPVSVSFK